MIFSDMRGRVQDRISDSTSSTQSIVDEKINETLEEIFGWFQGAKWYYREATFWTLPQLASVAANTCSVKRGERVVTLGGSYTVMPKRYIGADFFVTGDSDSYRIVDIGLPGLDVPYDETGTAVTDGWESLILLDRPYGGTTDTAATYQVTQDRYRLRSDVNTYVWINQLSDPISSYPIELAQMRDAIPDPVHEGATGEPYYHINLGRKTKVWANKYMDGDQGASATAIGGESDANVTNGSYNVTLEDIDTGHEGDSELWGTRNLAEDLQGLGFRVASTQRIYVVNKGNVPSAGATATTIELALEERYKGTTNANADFELGWIEAPEIQLYPVPTSAIQINYGYYVKEQILEADEDTPILPREYHTTLVDGAIWRMLAFLESSQQQAAFVRYQNGLERMKQNASLNRDRKWFLKSETPKDRFRFLNMGANYPPVYRR